jgi:hypothetical protein
VNDIQSWLHSSAAKAKFFLLDLTRKPRPDVIAITETDNDFAKGVILESARPADVGALWWTIRDDVQKGLEMGYFDVTKQAPGFFAAPNVTAQ